MLVFSGVLLGKPPEPKSLRGLRAHYVEVQWRAVEKRPTGLKVWENIGQ